MFRLLIMSMLVLTTSCAAWANFAMPQPAPINRLIQNTEAYIDEHPDDSMGQYTLGRIHYLAFSRGAEVVRIYSGVDRDHPDLPNLEARWMGVWPTCEAIQAHVKETVGVDPLDRSWVESDDPVLIARGVQAQKLAGKLRREGWQPEPALSKQALRAHLDAATQCLGRALEMDPDNALFQLTFASLADSAARHLQEGHLDPPENESREDEVRRQRQQALAHYHRSYDLSIKQDLNRDSLPLPGIGAMISYEAGTAIVRLAETDETLVAEDLHKRVEKSLSRLKEIPQRAITPIVLAVDRRHHLSDLIDQGARVRFDLDGDGDAERRPWLRPMAGLLVWDPAGEGRITSGRQLFGSVTWWMFWRSGYAALDALDDDRDGELAGPELRGLAVWFDRDGDTVSDPGEVARLEKLGIAALSVHATAEQAGSPMNLQGVRFQNGQVLPTWDWVAPATVQR